MKPRAKNAFTIIIGLLVAVGILCSSLIIPDTASPSEKVKTEQGEHEKETYVHATPATVAPSSVIAIESKLLATVLFEISVSTEQSERILDEPIAVCEQYLATLFRVIISPNAP